MSALYRHYRPQRFADVAGQEHVTTTLQKAIVDDRLAHAYLFHGPRGTGKTTTARILAHRLNCLKPEAAEPCGTCQNCVAAREHRLLDVIEIDAASNRGIDDIRSLQETVSMKPSFGTFKIYIIDEVHMLTREAFTALLKTLEEPAKNVIFILASTEFHKIPETIISRCQVFHFRRASEESMQKRLRYLLEQEKRVVEDDALSLIIQRSDGCYRDAESLLGQVLTLHGGIITYDNVTSHLGLPPQELLNQFLAALIRGESAGALAAIDRALALGFDPEQFMQESIRAARDGALLLMKNEPAQAAWQKEPHALAKLPTIIRALVQGMQDIAYVPEPSIALHLVIATVCTARGQQAVRTKNTISNQPPVTSDQQPRIENRESRIVKNESRITNNDSLKKVTAAWPKLIEAVKTTNPVAATFLRALQPISYSNGIVQLEARYALHRTFFERPDNQKLLDEKLSEVVGEAVTVRCVLVEPAATASPRAHVEHDLVSAVKDVFGQ